MIKKTELLLEIKELFSLYEMLKKSEKNNLFSPELTAELRKITYEHLWSQMEYLAKYERI